MRNRYESNCGKCDSLVPANSGTLVGEPGAWVTFCSECVPLQPAAKVPVEVTTSEGEIHLRLAGRAGDKFSLWRELTATCRLLKLDTGWVSSVSPQDAGAVLERIIEDGSFALSISDEARKLIDANAARVTSARDEVSERARALRWGDARLRDYQVDGAVWLASSESAILADEMGLGKTVQVLAALAPSASTLIVCPSAAKGVWAREVRRWRPDLEPVVLSGRGTMRAPAQGEVVIVNPECMGDEGVPCTNLVVDEAHAFKNTRTRRYQRLQECVVACDAVWLLTATPLLNSPPELWTLLKLIGRIPFRSYGEFARQMGAKQVCVPVKGRPEMVWDYSECRPSKLVAERLAGIVLRREKRDVLPDLPPKRYGRIDVPLDSGLCSELDKIIGNSSELPDFEEISEVRAALCAAKIPAMMREVERAELERKPLVVFSSHRSPVKALSDRPGWATITGGTSAERRSEIEDQFTAGKLRGVAATIGAGGVAITLTAADRLLFVGREWTPALNEQAEDRIHRIGQTRTCQIIDLVGDHALERRIYEVIARKSAMIDGTVGELSGRAELRSFTALGDCDDIDIEADSDSAAMAEALYREVMESREAARRAGNKERVERAWGDLKVRVSRNRRVSGDDLVRYVAATDEEERVASAVKMVAEMDYDRAEFQNGVGFAKCDVGIGHQIALRVDGGLTELEWRIAAMLARKYHRQVS